MRSTRLPGKVLKRVLGRPLLDYHLERLRQALRLDAICVATTQDPQDDPIAQFCGQTNTACFRGSESDVLSRYCGAAEWLQADLIVRVTSDCPLIDPDVIDRVVAFFQDHRDEFDYVSNIHPRSFPRGMDAEAFPLRLLRLADQETSRPEDREHVTPYFYRHPDRFRLGNVAHDHDESRHRWTVDTAEDFALIRRVLECVYPQTRRFRLNDLLDIVKRNPDWSKLNESVQQKPVT